MIKRGCDLERNTLNSKVWNKSIPNNRPIVDATHIPWKAKLGLANHLQTFCKMSCAFWMKSTKTAVSVVKTYCSG